jgi:hypothetical protein
VRKRVVARPSQLSSSLIRFASARARDAEMRAQQPDHRLDVLSRHEECDRAKTRVIEANDRALGQRFGLDVPLRLQNCLYTLSLERRHRSIRGHCLSGAAERGNESAKVVEIESDGCAAVAGVAKRYRYGAPIVRDTDVGTEGGFGHGAVLWWLEPSALD